MIERWRRPAAIAAIEEDPSRVYHDGNVYRRQVDITFDQETLVRMRLGYLCLRCLEPQEEAMPQTCSLCGYDMREFQSRDLANEFEGEKQIGPSSSIDDELEMLRERKRQKMFWTPPGAA